MTTTSQEKKQYILDNIDKYVVDGRRNFYWEDAKEGMSYIYDMELDDLGDAIDIGIKMGERISQTKEDWGLDFLQDDIHNPILLYKNKKDGRVLYALYVYLDREIGKSINDYKGTDEEILRLLRAWGAINEEQKKFLEEKEKERENFIKQTDEISKQQEEQIKKLKEERQKIPHQEPPQNDKKEGSEEKGNKNNLTQQPTIQEEEKNNPPTQQQPNKPIIDTTQIEQTESVPEAITTIKNQIQQVLKEHNLKTSDLPTKYQNWEEQLTKLGSKEEIDSLVAELNQQIESKLKKSKREQIKRERENFILFQTARYQIH